MSIKLEGFEDVSMMLTEVSPRAAKSYLVKCAKPAAQVVLDALDKTVPSDTGGTLKEVLIYKKKWLSNSDDAAVLEVKIGPAKGFFWGSLQEFGTSIQPAQHWMSKAWEGCKDEVLNVFVDNIRELTNRLIKRDMSEAMLKNDEKDRASGTTTPKKLRRDRRAAYRENAKRNGK